MNKNFYLKTALWAGLSAAALQSCVKSDDYSVPSINCTDKFGTANHTLSDLAALGKLAPAQSDIIASDYIVEGYVSSSDESGNLYKTLYVQDSPSNPTQAIEIDIDGASLYSNFPLGAKVRINAKGLIVQSQNGNVKLGSYDPSYAVGRINPNLLQNFMGRVCGTDGYGAVAKMVPVEFQSFSEALKPQNINKLIKVNNVQFKDDATGMGTTDATSNTFADANSASGASDRYLVDVVGTSFDLRNSTYANFAKTLMRPTYAGSGSVTMILSQYTSTSGAKSWQGYIRDLTDLRLTSPRLSLTSYFSDGFDNLNNWTAVKVTGSAAWTTTTFGNPKPSAYITAGNAANESWLVSKAVNLAGTKNNYVTFESDGRSSSQSAPPLELYYTTNYSGNPATTTWTKLNASFDSDLANYGGFVSAGLIDLSANNGKTVVFGFKYTSTVAGGGAAWEIDNFKVFGQ